MAITNGYTTLANVKDALRITSADATDDAVIERLVEGASRYIDAQTGRTFYARTETRYYSPPDDGGRTLWVDDDLLTITTLTNGDGNTVASSNYKLLPRNLSPYYGIRINQSSTVFWQGESDGDTEDVISIAGTWGYASTAPHDIRLACEAIAVTAYRSRFGENVQGAAQVTAAGVVITPSDVPQMARHIIERYRRMILAGV